MTGGHRSWAGGLRRKDGVGAGPVTSATDLLVPATRGSVELAKGRSCRFNQLGSKALS